MTTGKQAQSCCQVLKLSNADMMPACSCDSLRQTNSNHMHGLRVQARWNSCWYRLIIFNRWEQACTDRSLIPHPLGLPFPDRNPFNEILMSEALPADAEIDASKSRD